MIARNKWTDVLPNEDIYLQLHCFFCISRDITTSTNKIRLVCNLVFKRGDFYCYHVLKWAIKIVTFMRALKVIHLSLLRSTFLMGIFTLTSGEHFIVKTFV